MTPGARNLNDAELSNGTRSRKCRANCKAWGYLVCIGVVVVGALILIILTAMGVIKTSTDS